MKKTDELVRILATDIKNKNILEIACGAAGFPFPQRESPIVLIVLILMTADLMNKPNKAASTFK